MVTFFFIFKNQLDTLSILQKHFYTVNEIYAIAQLKSLGKLSEDYALKIKNSLPFLKMFTSC